MRREMKNRLRKLIGADAAPSIVIVHNALPPDDSILLPHIGETFGEYHDRLVADGKERGLQHVVVPAWYGAENRPYDGDWFGSAL